jgi:exopolysaccharide biosynthesis polyprenyl glycosylphosphotransferase
MTTVVQPGRHSLRERTDAPLRSEGDRTIDAEPLIVDEATRERVNAPNLRCLLFGLDAAGTALAWVLALLVPWSVSVSTSNAAAVAPAVAFVTAVTLMVMAGQRLYQARVCGVRAVEVARLGRTVVIVCAVVYAAANLAQLSVPTVRLVAGAALSFTILATSRSLFDAWLKLSRAKGRYSRPIVIIGANDEALDLYRLLHAHAEIGFRISGVIGPREEYAIWANGVPWLGEVDKTLEIMHARPTTGVVVATSSVQPDELNWLSRGLLDAGVHVHLSTGLKGIAQRRLRSLPLAHEPLFYLEPIALARWQLAVKRILDVVISATVLLVSAPLLAISALAIKLRDRGPVLFRQQRIGLEGEPFTLLKLRTMETDAEEQRGDVESMNERNGGPLFKATDDPRRTRVGGLLERLSIDELPQLVNVLRGEMSLVGPRPALPDEVGRFDDELLERLTVAPGITGLWQVEARDNPAFYAYRRLDLFYVENWSVTLDLAVLLATVRAVIVRPYRCAEARSSVGRRCE